MAARKGGSFQGPLTKTGSFRTKKSTKRGRKSKSKAKRPMMIKTTQRSMPIISANVLGGMTIQVDKLLSQVNHKLYRQGMNYHCRVQLAVGTGSTANDTEYEIYTLPTDHRTIGALRMARSVYNEAMKDELEIRPEVKSPWTDFKIGITNVTDSAQWSPLRNDGYVSALTASAADPTGVVVRGTSDNYAVSEITDAAGAQRSFQLKTVTSPTDAFNVYVEYLKFLLNRADPDSAVEIAAYSDASAVLTEMQELADKGDEPPYSWGWQQYDVAAGALQATAGLTVRLAGTISAGIVTRQQVAQFVDVEAPLGLIFVVATQNLDTAIPELIVTAKPGNYKGVKADRLYPKDKLLGF